MTPKDFELIAAQIKDAYDRADLDPSAERALERLADHMADALATTNPRFNRDRFLSACGDF